MRRDDLFAQRGAGTAASAAAHSLFLLRRAGGYVMATVASASASMVPSS